MRRGYQGGYQGGPDGKMNYFYCPSCKKVPLMRYVPFTSTIEIYCKDCQPNVAVVKLSERFLKEIDERNKFPLCTNSDRHGEEFASYFCTDACKRFFCNQCIDTHNQDYPDHLIVKTDGMVMLSKCEKKNCPTNGPIEFYCRDCNLHLCSDCKYDHPTDHLVSDIKREFDNDQAVEDAIRELDNKDRVIRDCYRPAEAALDDLEERVRVLRQYVNDQKKEGKNFEDYYQTLINCYDGNKQVQNYPIRKNLVDNRLSSVLEQREDLIKQRFLSEIHGSDFYRYCKNLKHPNEMDLNVRNTYINKVEPTRIIEGPPPEEVNDAPLYVEEPVAEPEPEPEPPKVLRKQKTEEIKKFEGINCLETLRDQLFAGSKTGDLYVYDYDEEDRKFRYNRELKAHKEGINSLAKTVRNRTPIIYTASNDCSVKEWNVDEENECMRTFSEHQDAVLKVIVLENGQIASGSKDMTIKIWDPDSNDDRSIATLTGSEAPVHLLAEIPGDRLVSCSTDNVISFWDLNNYSQPLIHQIPLPTKIYCIYYWKEDNSLLVGTEQKILLVDVDKLAVVGKAEEDLNGLDVLSIFPLKDGKFILGVNGPYTDVKLKKFDSKLYFKKVINYPFTFPIKIGDTFQNDKLVTCDTDGNVILWSY